MTTAAINVNIQIPQAREEWFMQLYEDTFPKVAKFVANRGGTFDDAKDIFHDALVILYEKIVDQNLAVEASPEFYLIGISKHLWIRKFNDDHRKIGLDEMENAITIPPDYFEEQNNRLTRLLETAGRKCLALLRAFYYDNLPLQQITNAFGFASVHSTSVQKFKCIEKMRNTIQEKSMEYEDFA